MLTTASADATAWTPLTQAFPAMCDSFRAMTLPPENPSRPAVQTLRWLFRPIEFMDEGRERYGETFGVKFIGFQTPLYFTSDPAAAKLIYSNSQNTLPPGRNTVLEPVMGPRSILLLEGSEHMARRKLMLPAFHGERMRAYESVIDEVIGREIHSWAQGEEFRIHPRMQSVTLEVILRAVFGVADEARQARMREALGVLVNQTASAGKQLIGLASQRFGRWGPWRSFEKTLRRVDERIYEEIAARRDDPELESREDILSMLLVARFEDGSEMSDSEVRDQLVTLLLAGHETTATALAWTFDLLLRHPEALERLRAEIAEGDDDEFLRAVISESLRLRPVVPIAGRRLAEEIEVDGYTLPAGADISPAIYLSHTRPDVYPDPHSFKPDRFLDGGPETYSWVPFGGGVRRCLGASFAEFEMRIVLREVLGRCRLQAASEQPEGIKRRNITFSPKRGTPVVLVERHAAPAEAALA
jgi:cytochrome P450 family 135